MWSMCNYDPEVQYRTGHVNQKAAFRAKGNLEVRLLQVNRATISEGNGDMEIAPEFNAIASLGRA